MRNPLSILFILLWLILGYFYWDSSNNCCDNNTNASEATTTTNSVVANEAAAVAVTTTNTNSGPLLFNWDKPDAVTGENWAEKKSSILKDLGSEKILEIIGKYRKDEANNTTFDNLGLARADEVRKLFGELPDERIRLLSRLTDIKEGDKSSLFESCDFAYKVNSASIKEVENKTRIYFPFNSTNKLKDAEVEKYLDDVATRVKQSGESIELEGHTDDIGSDASNITLGQRRAEIIKQYLLSRGVSESKISVSSKGESNPIATNATNAGRSENRRTELQIIK